MSQGYPERQGEILRRGGMQRRTGRERAEEGICRDCPRSTLRSAMRGRVENRDCLRDTLGSAKRGRMENREGGMQRRTVYPTGTVLLVEILLEAYEYLLSTSENR
jgi:hypothetical protein